MYIESILQSSLRPGSRPGLETTGNLKSVMKESSAIAYSFAKTMMVKTFPNNHFFDRAKIHLHVPEGAVQKDGPSAGITMATSMLSLALDRAVDPTVAMTGELTLTGKVLRIGGLREKTVAARRAGCKLIIFPEDNLSDWLELPEVGPCVWVRKTRVLTAGCRTSRRASRAGLQAGTRTSSTSSSPTSIASLQTSARFAK